MMTGAVLPIVAMMAVILISVPLVNAIRVNGPQFEKIATLREFNTDVAPPAAYVIEGYAAVQRVTLERLREERGDASELETARRDAALTDLNSARDAFNNADALYSRIEAHPNLVLARNEVFVTGREFFTIVDDNLLPALNAGNVTEADRIQAEDLASVFQRHRTAVHSLTALIDDEANSLETATGATLQVIYTLLAGGLFVVIAASLFLGIRRAASLSSRIRRLTIQAEEVATVSLPARVAEIETLRRGQQVDGLEPFAASGNDELSILASALTSMQNTALSQAVGQAKIRQSVSESLVNVGRRNQSLITRALEYISSLEQSERDTDTLDKLFRLDHMTTRMRRQAESLLVLADAERADGWAEDEEIGDVVRGSLSEIESYRQVAIAALEPIVVKGSAVDPLIHLLAELLENATQFSPPTTKVTVYGRQTDNGYHLAIIDHGLGMTPEELQQANAKLVSELDLLTDASTVIGHAVVAKIARRYGILVRLSDNQPGAGITANVLIPQSLIGTTGGSPARGAAMAGRSMGPAPSAHAQAGRRGSQASSPTAHVVAHSVAQGVPSWPQPAQPYQQTCAPHPLGQPPVVANPAVHDRPSSIPAEQFRFPDAPPSDEPVIKSPGPAPAPLPSLGFAKRVPGAQLPDLGGARNDQPAQRSPEEIRAQLSDFHSGWTNGQG